MSRRRAWPALVAFVSVLGCAAASPRTDAVAVRVRMDVSGSRRPPRYGFGNELVLQSTNDSLVSAALRSGSGTIARYPGTVFECCDL